MPEEEEKGRKKREGKGFSKRKMVALALVLLIFFVGVAFQHYCVEPLIGQETARQHAECLTQKGVLDQRFVECSNAQRACQYQLDQCQET